MRRRKLSGLLWGIGWGFLLVSLVQAAEYSAVMVTKTRGRELQGKFYVKGEKERSEVSAPRPSVTIIRRDKKVAWILMPGQKSYMEMPLDPNQQKSPAEALTAGGWTKKLLGTETLNGYEAEKYELTKVKPNGQEIKHIIWFSKKLGGPLRIESADKSFRIDYKDIKEGGVDDALFEIPAGYQKMSLPAGMPKGK